MTLKINDLCDKCKKVFRKHNTERQQKRRLRIKEKVAQSSGKIKTTKK
jgi:hypothetical protein